MLFANLLLAAAEEGPPPLIDLDGTVLIQLGLFLIMVVVLWRFLFTPYLKMRDERGKGIEGARKEAHDMESRAQKIVADYDAQLNRAKLRGAEERARLRGEAATRERQLLGAARDEAQRALGDARGKIATDAAAAEKALAGQASSLAKLMARRIIGREVA